MRILVAGAGPVGKAVGAALELGGVNVERWTRAEGVPPAKACAAAIIAVPDRAIEEVAVKLVEGGAVSPTGVLLHCAGALPAEAAFGAVRRRVAGVAVMHPLRALAGGAEDAQMQGTVFAVEGDAVGRKFAMDLALRIGGRPVELDAASLARYHAAAVLAANHTLGLVDVGIGLLEGIGLGRREAAAALGTLLSSAARNVAEKGLPNALTGPIARGDAATVRRHLAALDGMARVVYVATARVTLALARKKGTGEAEGLDEIAIMLSDGELTGAG